MKERSGLRKVDTTHRTNVIPKGDEGLVDSTPMGCFPWEWGIDWRDAGVQFAATAFGAFLGIPAGYWLEQKREKRNTKRQATASQNQAKNLYRAVQIALDGNRRALVRLIEGLQTDEIPVSFHVDTATWSTLGPRLMDLDTDLELHLELARAFEDGKILERIYGRMLDQTSGVASALMNAPATAKRVRGVMMLRSLGLRNQLQGLETRLQAKTGSTAESAPPPV